MNNTFQRLNILVFLFFFTTFIGCKQKDEIQPQIAPELEVIATHIATFEVEGMMCEKGCGAVLRKGLYETGGVAQVDVSFDEEEPINEIRVFFDISKVATEDIIGVIGELADKRYSAKLKRVSESKLNTSLVEQENKEQLRNEISPIVNTEISTPRMTFPSLTKLFNKLIN